jgi:hypothetical protein
MLSLLLAGCDSAAVPAPAPVPVASPVQPGRLFDRARAGTIQGWVLWRGPRPQAPPFRSAAQPLSDQLYPPVLSWPNPNVPVVDAKGALAGAVVFLRGIDPARGRPWDLPRVRVEMKKQQFHVEQGATRGRAGFVLAGESIDMVSQDNVFHSVQARGNSEGEGSAFFNCPLPDPEQVRQRRLPREEIVELASGCGYVWMRAYLFVTTHPYYALTDSAGRFRLRDVPAGTYEIVAWHPSWRVTQQQRNPDNARVQQVRFAEALQSRAPVQVQAGQTASVELSLAAP